MSQCHVLFPSGRSVTCGPAPERSVQTENGEEDKTWIELCYSRHIMRYAEYYNSVNFVCNETS